VEQADPDVFVISTPPDKHCDYFLYAAKKKKHFFVEAATSVDGYAELFPLLDNTFVAAPSCTFKYFPGVVKIKSLLKDGAIGKPLSFVHYLGQYLPDWHPYEDYRQVYFAKKGTGGAREMFPYELIWLADIFSDNVKSISGVRGKKSDLEITADDMYAATAQFDNGIVGTMMIDLLNRKASRTLKIIGTEGTLDWDWLGKKITVFDVRTGEDKTLDLDSGKKVEEYNTGEEAYEAEIKDFLEAIEGEKVFPYSFEEDFAILSHLDDFIDI
jgi:predicted dehydrogenase